MFARATGSRSAPHEFDIISESRTVSPWWVRIVRIPFDPEYHVAYSAFR